MHVKMHEKVTFITSRRFPEESLNPPLSLEIFFKIHWTCSELKMLDEHLEKSEHKKS
jgi:hypothetical protein